MKINNHKFQPLLYLIIFMAFLLLTGRLITGTSDLRQQLTTINHEIELLEAENAALHEELQESLARLEAKKQEILAQETEKKAREQQTQQDREQQTQQDRELYRMIEEMYKIFNPDGWEPQELEITGYAPLDPRAVPGVCHDGNPHVTANGAPTTPGITAAAGSEIPYGTRVLIPGRGLYVVQDRGGAVSRTEDGLLQVDICVWDQDEALEIGRERVWGVVER